jgi:hypothetical protein
MHIINLIQENEELIAAIVVAVYEVIVRKVPTAKSWSLFTFLGRLIPDKTTENEAR